MKVSLRKFFAVFFCAAIALVLFALVFFYFSFGKIFNHMVKNGAIEKNFRDTYGLELRLKEPQVSTKPSLSAVFSANEIVVFDPVNKKDVLNVTDAKVRLRVLPLIFKRIHFVNIEAGYLSANIFRDKNGAFNIEKFFKAGGEFYHDFRKAKIRLNNYVLSFEDDFLNNAIVLKGESFNADGLDKKKKLALSTSGSLSIYEKTSKKNSVTNYSVAINSKMPLNKHFKEKDFKFNILVTNFAPGPYEKYLKQFAHKDLTAIGGIFNLEVSPSKADSLAPLFLEAKAENFYFAFSKDGKHSSVKAVGLGKIRTHFNINDKEIFLEDLSYITKDIDANLQGKISNYKNKRAVVSLKAFVKNSSARSLSELIPECIKTPEDSIAKIKRYKLNGTLDADMEVAGPIKRPKIFGKASFKNFYFGDGVSGYLGKGFCEFTGNGMTLNAVIDFLNGQNVDIIGITEIFVSKPKASFNIKSSPNLDAESALSLTLKFKNIFGFELGPLPMMKIKGIGELAIKTKGTKEKARIDGYFKLKGISGSFDGINTTMKNAVGQILFKGHEITFNGIKAEIEGAPSKIDGVSNTSGDLDITFNIPGIKLSNALKIATTSPLIKEQTKALKLVKAVQGDGNILLNLKGNVKNLKDISKLAKNPEAMTLEPTLKIEFLNSSALTEPNIEVKNLRGTVDFVKNIFNIKVLGRLYNSDFDITGTTEPLKKSARVNLNFVSKTFKLEDYFSLLTVGLKTELNQQELFGVDFLKKLNLVFSTKINAKGEIPFNASSVQKIDLRGILLSGGAYPVNSKASELKFSSGGVKFQGQKVLFDNLNFNIWGAQGLLYGNIDKIFDQTQMWNPKLVLKNFSLTRLNAPSAQRFLPEEVRNKLSSLENLKGNISLLVEVINNNIGGEVSFSNVSAFNKSKKAQLELKSGEVKMSANKLDLKALNLSFGDMPFYFDGVVSNFNSQNPYLDASFSLNASEATVDTFVNPNLAYPIKVKGEIGIKGRLKGYRDNYNLSGNAILNPQTDISYMGATFGDFDLRREIRLNATFKNDSIRLNNVEFLKYLYSQNNRAMPLGIIRASGGLYARGGNFYLDDFSVKTLNPAPAGLFNILFKKSILKQGNFNCDLNLNGPVMSPKMLGSLKFNDINIPLYSSQIKDADFDLRGATVHGTLTGTGLESDIKINTEIQNSLSLPFVFKKFDIVSEKVSIDKILNELSLIASMQKSPGAGVSSGQVFFSPKDIVVENGTFSAKEVSLYKIKAENLDLKFSQNTDGIFKMDDMVFDIAGGKILTKGSFDFDKAYLSINSQVVDCDANSLSDAFLGISNQLYGRMNGEISLTGSQLHTAKGLETVSAKAQFEVKNGKMPKLGSLEYLLRAGNFLKSGVLGLSINNIIELVTPFKTGEFKTIKGNLVIENGKANTLEIYSKGENLSLFAHGTYDLATSNANIELLGRLSKKVSNLLGPIGNMSVNTLLGALAGKTMNEIAKTELVQNINKIPLIELSNEDVRIFVVKVQGDLNKEGYIKSFNWAD